MRDYISDRVITLAEYIVENKSTVRSAAKKFGVSKSTVHKDMSERLRTINRDMWQQVHSVLEKNKAERHIRGGLATKRKYLAK
ncbi:MAG: sporulation transcriptional regulator SpoIIID [Eubacteriales bacterium]|nr:sporulation transcriptional regulator SpoIIID [Eubacteriales bacterium]